MIIIRLIKRLKDVAKDWRYYRSVLQIVNAASKHPDGRRYPRLEALKRKLEEDLPDTELGEDLPDTELGEDLPDTELGEDLPAFDDPLRAVPRRWDTELGEDLPDTELGEETIQGSLSETSSTTKPGSLSETGSTVKPDTQVTVKQLEEFLSFLRKHGIG
jgi:hypothetical protein